MSQQPQHKWILSEWKAQMKLTIQSQFHNLTCPRRLRNSVDTPVHYEPDDIDMQAAHATLLRSLLAGGGNVASREEDIDMVMMIRTDDDLDADQEPPPLVEEISADIGPLSILLSQDSALIGGGRVISDDSTQMLLQSPERSIALEDSRVLDSGTFQSVASEDDIEASLNASFADQQEAKECLNASLALEVSLAVYEDELEGDIANQLSIADWADVQGFRGDSSDEECVIPQKYGWERFNSSSAPGPLTRPYASVFRHVHDFVPGNLRRWSTEGSSLCDEFIRKIRYEFPLMDIRYCTIVGIARRMIMDGVKLSLVDFAGIISDDYMWREGYGADALGNVALERVDMVQMCRLLATVSDQENPWPKFMSLQYSKLGDGEIPEVFAEENNGHRRMLSLQYPKLRSHEIYLLCVIQRTCMNFADCNHYISVAAWNIPILGCSLRDLTLEMRNIVNADIERYWNMVHGETSVGLSASRSNVIAAFGSYFTQSRL